MGARQYVDRLKSDYRKTFNPECGTHVLMDLYTHCHGNRSSMDPTGNPGLTAFNEGKRWVWLRIMEHLRIEDPEIRKLLERHLAERAREETL